MSKLVDAAASLAAVFRDDMSVEALLTAMEVYDEEQLNEEAECKCYGPTGHMDAMLAEQNKDFLELEAEVKNEYGVDLRKTWEV